MQNAFRLAYSCHDSFPSGDTNTHQIFWTITEVARLGIAIDLLIPSISEPGEPRTTVGSYYGVPIDAWPAALRIVSADRRAGSWLAKGLFDSRVPRRLESHAYDLIWTRDIVAAAACVRLRLPVVFETYRPDLATRARFAAWRAFCLGSPHLRGLILHSQIAADAFIGAGAPADRLVVAHNGFAPSLMTPALDRLEARRMLNIAEDGPLVVYAGHSGPEKGLDAVIRMAALTPRVRFLILGLDPASNEPQAIERRAIAAGAHNVLLRQRVRVSEVAPYLYAADCLIIPPSEEPLRRFGGTVLPMKLFMYLAAGRPILAPRLPDIEEMLTDGVTARLVSPADPVRSTEALLALLNDRELQDRLSRNAVRAAAEYTWSARAHRLVEFFERILTPAAAIVLSAAS